MADYDELEIDRAGPPPPPDERGPSTAPWIVLLIVVAFAVGGYVWWSRRPAANRPPPVHVAETRPAVVPPQAVAPENIELPPLGQTDSVVRQLVGRLSSHPLVMRWLATDQLIRNFAVVLTNTANGRTPSKQLQAVRPGGRFVVARDAQGEYIDPASYRRYDAYADAVAGLDPAGTARVYETLKPRIADAYRELGFPDGDVDSALKRAIVLLLQTPVVDGRVGLSGSPPLYIFSDERLESLTGAQRQLLRMGPRNERIVQDKLRAIAPLVGIGPEDLPPPRPVR